MELHEDYSRKCESVSDRYLSDKTNSIGDLKNPTDNTNSLKVRNKLW